MNKGINLLELQRAQQRHDELAHRDILCLPMKDRIRHMVFHFAKYTGRLAELQTRRDDERFIATLVDTFIICLASANSLCINLSEKLAGPRDNNFESTFVNSCEVIAEMPRIILPYTARITGEMAKACESLDHLERFDYRETLERGMVDLTELSLSVARRLNLRLPELAQKRWRQVEQKSIFYSEPLDTATHKESLRLASNNKP
jgi:hypothetical protein